MRLKSGEPQILSSLSHTQRERRSPDEAPANINSVTLCNFGGSAACQAVPEHLRPPAAPPRSSWASLAFGSRSFHRAFLRTTPRAPRILATRKLRVPEARISLRRCRTARRGRLLVCCLAAPGSPANNFAVLQRGPGLDMNSQSNCPICSGNQLHEEVCRLWRTFFCISKTFECWSVSALTHCRCSLRNRKC